MKNAIRAHLRERVHKALGVGADPRQLAAAWAVGVAIALSPLLGLHTLLALLAAFALRLNKVDVLLGTLVINPWTLPVYFPAAVVVGHWTTGIDLVRLTIPSPEKVLHVAMWRQQAHWLKPVLISWATGATLIAIVGGLLTYALSLRLIQFLRRHTHHHDAVV